jgi:uncharacterized protein YdhG (YjbR/CyaY superfamily)
MAATKTATKRKSPAQILTADEKEAMRELVKERKAAKGKVDGEADVLAKIAELPTADRSMAERIHALVKANAPDLAPRTWYGMPAYTRDGKVVCFFKAASKFESRYATFGFEDAAKLDDGAMWPTSYALTKLTAADEKKLGELVKKAAG